MKTLCDNSHRKGGSIAGDFTDYRSGARSGPTAHAHGNEHHVRATERILQLFVGFLCGFLSDLRLAARAKTFGELIADADLPLSLRAHQGLRVGVHRNELNAANPALNHAVYRIAAGATAPTTLI